MKVVMIDYDVGNIGSLMSAFDEVEIPYTLTSDPDLIEAADAIILPGVGAFAAAMAALEAHGLVDVLKRKAQSGIPFLGICLGMQLLFESSEENGDHVGLGLLPGTVKAIPEASFGATLKIPHMGWNQLDFHQDDELLKYIKEGDHVYFVHSYYVDTVPDLIVTSSDYGVKIPGITRKGNLIGMQFHPEKSSDVGLNLLRAFKDVLEGDNV